jgi:hypothetical protein
MKFPSIKNLADGTLNTLKRFPFEILFALGGTIAQTISIHRDYSGDNSGLEKLVMTANLGLLLSLAATLYTENKGDKKYNWLIRVVAALLGASFYFIFSRQLATIHYTRFFLLSFAFHLLVSFAAFTGKGHIQGFWQFNKTLFLRFLASMLYSAVLCLGLDAALAASNFLFNLHLDYKTYLYLFTWIAGMFNTIFFLAGVPQDTGALDEDTSYPKALKVFTQYVLIPLASIYLIILLTYEVKILIQWNLPKGLVSNLILGYAVFGILSILLVYPLREQEGNKWIKTYARSFYFLLLPLLVLLVLAIISRVRPYGVTPYRYFLIILAGWLSFITFYFLLSRRQNIKLIPISLCILALLAVYGPQSAFSVSDYSQRKILTDIFKKYGAVKDGRLQSLAKIKVDSADGAKVVDKLNYFTQNSTPAALQPYIKEDMTRLVDSISHLKNSYAKYGYISRYELAEKESEWLQNYFGVKRFGYTQFENTNYYDFTVKNDLLLNTKGYDYVLAFKNEVIDEKSAGALTADNLVVKQSESADRVCTLYLNNEKVSFNVKGIADSLVKKKNELKAYKNDNTATYGTNEYYSLPDRLLSFTQQSPHYKVTFQISSLRFNSAADGAKADTENLDDYSFQIDGYYLISVLK